MQKKKNPFDDSARFPKNRRIVLLFQMISSVTIPIRYAIITIQEVDFYNGIREKIEKRKLFDPLPVNAIEK